MGTTSLGIVYADSTHNTRIWELDQEQADSINTYLLGHTAKPILDVFTSNGIWNKPVGARKHRVRCKGGGGAGGGVVGATSPAQGEGGYGGAGGWAEKWFDSSELAGAITVTVGAGGTGVSGAAGNGGGNTSFQHTTPVVGNGGGGGAAMTATTTNSVANGGAGGAASGGDINIAGQPGGKGRVLAGQPVLTAVGGNGVYGQGAFSRTGAQAGVPGGNYGGGGGGAYGTTASLAGGAGAGGICIVETWK